MAEEMSNSELRMDPHGIHISHVVDVIIDALDLPASVDSADQVTTMLRALEIYGKKDRLYGSAWKRLGALNNLTRMSTKVERLLEMYWHQDNHRLSAESSVVVDLDDAYDLLNYSCFFVAQASKGQWTRG